MDIAATILAGLIILSVPFLWFFGGKARARREQNIAEIKSLVEERSRALEERSRGLEERSRELTELHSRLDALSKQGSHGELAANVERINERWRELPTPQEDMTRILKLLAKGRSSREMGIVGGLGKSIAAAELLHFSTYNEITDRSAAMEEYLAALEAIRPETWLTTYFHWVEESKAEPEWLKDVSSHEPTRTEGLRRKSGWWRGGQRPLADLSYWGGPPPVNCR